MGHAFNQYQSALQRSCEHAVSYIESLPERKIDQVATSEQLRHALGGPLPLEGSDPAAVIDEMVKNVDAG
ncbi:aromatic-L-amino-acid decarboxylase [Photobacterium aphoticum]|uniref:Aromatic-L-amino-acid decarboxylase n=1 Tax=Photobacterium aphoticum TaxID=754436 RepID=A0A090QNT0_9GAMM|nr:aromatic-L-amino-acid decarboxylase [Photobacterium aphoticum]